ncbi:MAG: TrkA family potassium uptake protein [Clostridia bacterium]|nr:TrkA family potassium uptake protein [Clostridia bacterium]
MQAIVIGSGRVARHLSARLISQGDDVVLVDSDAAALETIPLDCIKIRGIPFDRDVLKNAGAETADVLIAVSSNDNVNIMTAEVAKELFNMKKVYARIANPDNRDAFEALGVRTVCSTSLVVDWLSSAISGEDAAGSFRMFGSSLRFTTVRASAGLEGLTLSKLEPDQNQIVFGILRDDRLLLFNPDMKVRAGDSIVICAQN